MNIVPFVRPFLRLLCASPIALLLIAAQLPSLSALLTAQQPPPGYSAGLRTLTSNAGNVLQLSAGRRVSFDGQSLTLESGLGSRVLVSFPSPVFGSFTVALDSGHLLFGESSTNGLWLVPLNGPLPLQPLATLSLNYDAAPYSPTLAVVSAKTGGWSAADNDLWIVDTQTGTTQLLAQIPGASGAVAVSTSGDIYYATASPLYPTPPGTTEVLRFRRAVVDLALQQNQVLGIAHADLMWSGLDSASDLEFDDDGDLFFVDWWNNRVGELNDVASTAAWVTTLIDYGVAPYGPATLQFLRGNNPAVFEPMQPVAGTLVVHETSFGTLSQLRTVQAQQPSTTIAAADPVPSGAFTIGVSNGPAQGVGLVAIGLSGMSNPTATTVAGFEAPLWWDAGLLSASWTQLVTFDSQGRANLTLTNPGTAMPVTFLTQTACLSAAAGTLGSTAPTTFRLGQ